MLAQFMGFWGALKINWKKKNYTALVHLPFSSVIPSGSTKIAHDLWRRRIE